MTDAARVVIRDEVKSELNLKGFQSKAAKEAQVVRKVEEQVVEEPVLAEVEAASPEVITVVDLAEQEKLVKVRARENVLNMRVGTRTFSLYANKECLVPRFVQQHLQERNLV